MYGNGSLLSMLGGRSSGDGRNATKHACAESPPRQRLHVARMLLQQQQRMQMQMNCANGQAEGGSNELAVVKAATEGTTTDADGAAAGSGAAASPIGSSHSRNLLVQQAIDLISDDAMAPEKQQQQQQQECDATEAPTASSSASASASASYSCNSECSILTGASSSDHGDNPGIATTGTGACSSDTKRTAADDEIHGQDISAPSSTYYRRAPDTSTEQQPTASRTQSNRRVRGRSRSAERRRRLAAGSSAARNHSRSTSRRRGKKVQSQSSDQAKPSPALCQLFGGGESSVAMSVAMPAMAASASSPPVPTSKKGGDTGSNAALSSSSSALGSSVRPSVEAGKASESSRPSSGDSGPDPAPAANDFPASSTHWWSEDEDEQHHHHRRRRPLSPSTQSLGGVRSLYGDDTTTVASGHGSVRAPAPVVVSQVPNSSHPLPRQRNGLSVQSRAIDTYGGNENGAAPALSSSSSPTTRQRRPLEPPGAYKDNFQNYDYGSDAQECETIDHSEEEDEDDVLVDDADDIHDDGDDDIHDDDDGNQHGSTCNVVRAAHQHHHYHAAHEKYSNPMSTAHDDGRSVSRKSRSSRREKASNSEATPNRDVKDTVKSSIVQDATGEKEENSSSVRDKRRSRRRKQRQNPNGLQTLQQDKRTMDDGQFNASFDTLEGFFQERLQLNDVENSKEESEQRRQRKQKQLHQQETLLSPLTGTNQTARERRKQREQYKQMRLSNSSEESMLQTDRTIEETPQHPNMHASRPSQKKAHSRRSRSSSRGRASQRRLSMHSAPTLSGSEKRTKKIASRKGSGQESTDDITAVTDSLLPPPIPSLSPPSPVGKSSSMTRPKPAARARSKSKSRSNRRRARPASNKLQQTTKRRDKTVSAVSRLEQRKKQIDSNGDNDKAKNDGGHDKDDDDDDAGNDNGNGNDDQVEDWFLQKAAQSTKTFQSSSSWDAAESPSVKNKNDDSKQTIGNVIVREWQSQRHLSSSKMLTSSPCPSTVSTSVTSLSATTISTATSSPASMGKRMCPKPRSLSIERMSSKEAVAKKESRMMEQLQSSIRTSFRRDRHGHSTNNITLPTGSDDDNEEVGS